MKFSKLQKAMADIKQKAPISVLFAVAFLGLQTPAFAVDSDNDGLDDSVEGTSDVPYTVADDDGNVSAPANVSVTVAGAPPVATPNSATTATDTLSLIHI